MALQPRPPSNQQQQMMMSSSTTSSRPPATTTANYNNTVSTLALSSNQPHSDVNNDTIRSTEYALSCINESIDRCRNRLRSQQQQRVVDLHSKDEQRLQLLNAQHERRRLAMEQQCNRIAEKNDKGHVLRHDLQQRVDTYVTDHREKEFQKRIAFELRRMEVLDKRDAAAEELKTGVFVRYADQRPSLTTPRIATAENSSRAARGGSPLTYEQLYKQAPPSRQGTEGPLTPSLPPGTADGQRGSSRRGVEWQRKPHPQSLSKEVAERLFPSPRRCDAKAVEPQNTDNSENNAEGGEKVAADAQERQRQRDEQVEHARLLQEQKLKEKMSQREEHVAALKQRLDESIQRTRDHQNAKQKKKAEKDEQAKEWRWKQHHKLRAEAIARLDEKEQQNNNKKKDNSSSSTAATPTHRSTATTPRQQQQQQQQGLSSPPPRWEQENAHTNNNSNSNSNTAAPSSNHDTTTTKPTTPKTKEAPTEVEANGDPVVEPTNRKHNGGASPTTNPTVTPGEKNIQPEEPEQHMEKENSHQDDDTNGGGFTINLNAEDGITVEDKRQQPEEVKEGEEQQEVGNDVEPVDEVPPAGEEAPITYEEL